MKSIVDTPSNVTDDDHLPDDQAEAGIPAGHVIPHDAVGDWLLGLAKQTTAGRSNGRKWATYFVPATQ
jgi:hypothetical protein